MILYACPKCGKWSDVSFGKYIKDSWNKAFSDAPDKQMPLTYPCEDGCGLMAQVQPTERIFVHPTNCKEYDPHTLVSIVPLEDS